MRTCSTATQGDLILGVYTIANAKGPYGEFSPARTETPDLKLKIHHIVNPPSYRPSGGSWCRHPMDTTIQRARCEHKDNFSAQFHFNRLHYSCSKSDPRDFPWCTRKLVWPPFCPRVDTLIASAFGITLSYYLFDPIPQELFSGADDWPGRLADEDQGVMPRWFNSRPLL